MKKWMIVLAVALGAFSLAGLAQQAEEKRKVLFENERVRVREVIMEPGIDYPPHTHHYPHVGVFIKGGRLQFTEGGKVDTGDFADGQAGWRDSGVTHAIRNVGEKAVHVVEVELKK